METQDRFGERYRRWIDRYELPAAQATALFQRIMASLPLPDTGKKGTENNANG